MSQIDFLKTALLRLEPKAASSLHFCFLEEANDLGHFKLLLCANVVDSKQCFQALEFKVVEVLQTTIKGLPL